MILSSQSIARRINHGDLGIEPFADHTIEVRGLSYGLGPAGYDIRIDLKDHQMLELFPGGFELAVAMERLTLPPDLAAMVKDKSTWARRGLAVQNTIAEPGWYGYLTLELSNHSNRILRIHHGDPIAQVVFMQLDEPTSRPYSGKYQDQPAQPVPAIMEEETV